MKTRTVALYGSNLAMSAICASLQKKPELQVQEIEGSLPDVIKKLEVVPPDVILFDLAAGQPDFDISALRNHPKIMLIGVDIANRKMLVWSGEQSSLVTANDLIKVIEGGTNVNPGISREKDDAFTRNFQDGCLNPNDINPLTEEGVP